MVRTSVVASSFGLMPRCEAFVERQVAPLRQPDAQFCDSLMSGFLTSAAARGASVFKMMDVSRHKSIDTLRAYVRDAEIFRDHAGNGLL